MKYLKRGLKRTLKSIKENKGLFTLLIFLQLIFLILIIVVSTSYQLKIFEDAKGVIEPLQNANYDANSIEEGKPFTEEMVNIYSSYVSMRNNVAIFAAWLLLLFIFVNVSIWVFTHVLLGNINLKNYKKIFQTWLKMVSSVILIFGPFLLISYYLLASILKTENVQSFSSTTNILLYALIGLYYIAIVCFALANQNNWKIFAKSVYEKSIKKISKTLPILLINVLIVLGCGYLVYFVVNNVESFLSLILASLLFIFSLVITRIYWIASINETNNY